MKYRAGALVLLVLVLKSAFASSCNEILGSNPEQDFSTLKRQVEDSVSLDALRSFSTKWAVEGNVRRDEALACLKTSDPEDRERFWKISYAYRFLADTVRPLLDPSSSPKTVESYRRELVQRIELARHSLSYD